MTQETPLEHSSLVGGSTAARRIGCPASYQYEQKVPKSPGSSYAREGTALHEMMAIILEQDKDPSELLPFTHNQPPKGNEPAWSLTIDEYKWAELGEVALQAFDQFVDELEAETGEPFEFLVEKSCEFPGIPGAFGTSDVLFKCGAVRGVVDWKFGRGPVAAENNKQLMFYMIAALNTFPVFFGTSSAESEFRLAIIQPQISDEADHWTTTGAGLGNFRTDLLAAIEEAQGADPTCAKGPWCAFADCRVICPLHLGAAAKLGELMVQREQAKEGPRDASGKLLVDFDYDAFLAEALGIADDVGAWAKHVAAAAQERINAGGAVPGWKTVPKRSAGRDWHPDLTVEQIKQRLSYRGLKADEYAPRKLVTPPAAEKLLKKYGKELPEETYVQKPSSGTTLVREGDPRDAAKRPTDVTAALASALAQKTT